MTPDQKAALDQLQRNDVERAEGIARDIAHTEGELPGAVAYYLAMLQDDPAEFNGRISDLVVRGDRGAL